MHYAPNEIHENHNAVGEDEGLRPLDPLNLMYYEVNNRLYHSMPGISSSNFGDMLEDLPGFVAGVDAFEDDTPADHFVLGEMVHSGALEGTLEFLFAPYTGKVRRGKQWEEFKKECEEKNKTPVSTSMWEQANKMVESLDGSTEFGEYIESGYIETSGWINDPYTGILCKVRPDILVPLDGGQWHIVDLKTTRCPEWEGEGRHKKGFKFSIQNYGYDRQAAFYTDMLTAMGFNISGFTFFVVGKEEPWNVHEYRLPPAWIEEGRREYRQLLKKYKRYITYV